MTRDGLKKHQPATPTNTIMKNFETEVLGMLTLMDADSLACVCGILGLVVQKKGNLKLLLKNIFRHFNVLLRAQNYMITLSESIKKENIKQ